MMNLSKKKLEIHENFLREKVFLLKIDGLILIFYFQMLKNFQKNFQKKNNC